jgi:hypothetical protein
MSEAMKRAWILTIILPAVQGFSASQLQGDWVDTYPVGLGTYNNMPAAFLSTSRKLTSPNDELLPLPIDRGAVQLLQGAMDPNPQSKAALFLACQSLINRDGSAYDNLPYEWGLERAKNTAYGRFQGKDLPQRVSGYSSPYDVMQYCITADCRAVLRAVMIEEDDSSAGGISLGGALCLERLPEMMQFFGEEIARPFSGGEQSVVECSIDEALGLAIAQGQPVAVERSIWESATVSCLNCDSHQRAVW